MNLTQSSTVGWQNSYMRNSICGTSLSSYSGKFIGVLPSDLRSVLKTVTKYSNNAGYDSTSSAITSTTDVIFLLSPYEIAGRDGKNNTYESTKQA